MGGSDLILSCLLSPLSVISFHHLSLSSLSSLSIISIPLSSTLIPPLIFPFFVSVPPIQHSVFVDVDEEVEG